MAQLHYGEAHSREQVLIMDRRMLHFDAQGNFIDEIPYTIKYISRNIMEVNGLSILANVDSGKVEIAYIINHIYGTFTVNGRASLIIQRLHKLDGVVTTLTRMTGEYLQSFILFNVNVPITLEWIKGVITEN